MERSIMEERGKVIIRTIISFFTATTLLMYNVFKTSKKEHHL